MERFTTSLGRRVDDAGMEKLEGDAREVCARAEREVVRHPDKYFGYAECCRVSGSKCGEGGVFLCRRSHETATWADEAWTLRTLSS